MSTLTIHEDDVIPAPRTAPRTATRPVHFSADFRTDHLRLVIRDSSGRNIGTFEMKPRPHSSRWDLTLRLMPGLYRYRYYGERNGQVIYVSPKDVNDENCLIDGDDALICVADHSTSAVEVPRQRAAAFN